MPFVNHPTAARANGGDLQPVFCRERFELIHRNRIGIGRKNFDSIIAQLCRLAAPSDEVVPENKRAAFGFLDQ